MSYNVPAIRVPNGNKQPSDVEAYLEKKAAQKAASSGNTYEKELETLKSGARQYRILPS